MAPPYYALQEWLALGLGISSEFVVLLLIFAVGNLLLPLFASVAAAWLGRAATGFQKRDSLRDTVAAFAPAFVPVGFGIWFAHYSFHLLVGPGLIVPVMQEFLGGSGDWGRWSFSLDPSLIGLIQLAVLLVGFPLELAPGAEGGAASLSAQGAAGLAALGPGLLAADAGRLADLHPAHGDARHAGAIRLNVRVHALAILQDRLGPAPQLRAVLIHDRLGGILRQVTAPVSVGHIGAAAVEGAAAEDYDAAGGHDGGVARVIALVADLVVGSFFYRVVDDVVARVDARRASRAGCRPCRSRRTYRPARTSRTDKRGDNARRNRNPGARRICCRYPPL